MGPIFVIGDLRAELVLQGLSGHPRRGREVFVSSARIRPGGGGARFSAALRRLGRNVTLFAKVGRDDLGSALLRDVNGTISYAGISRDSKSQTGMTVLFSDGEDASAVSFPGAAASMTARDVGRLNGCSGTRLHVVSPSQLLGLPLAALLRRVRSRGMTVSLSAGTGPRGTADLEELSRLVDLILLDESGVRGRGNLAAAPLVVVRRGQRGAVATTRGQEWRAPGLAAGPVFDAAFVDGWLEGHRVGDVLRYAIAASSLAADRGGQIDATPSRAEALHHVGRMKQGRKSR